MCELDKITLRKSKNMVFKVKEVIFGFKSYEKAKNLKITLIAGSCHWRTEGRERLSPSKPRGKHMHICTVFMLPSKDSSMRSFY
jgi:hypothetical protein